VVLDKEGWMFGCRGSRVLAAAVVALVAAGCGDGEARDVAAVAQAD
jgi:hypothetical protein